MFISRKKKRRTPSRSPSERRDSPSPPPKREKRSRTHDSAEEGELSEEELERKRMQLLKQLEQDDD